MPEWVYPAAAALAVIAVLRVWWTWSYSRCPDCNAKGLREEMHIDRVGTARGSGANYGRPIKVPVKVCIACNHVFLR